MTPSCPFSYGTRVPEQSTHTISSLIRRSVNTEDKIQVRRMFFLKEMHLLLLVKQFAHTLLRTKHYCKLAFSFNRATTKLIILWRRIMKIHASFIILQVSQIKFHQIRMLRTTYLIRTCNVGIKGVRFKHCIYSNTKYSPP